MEASTFPSGAECLVNTPTKPCTRAQGGLPTGCERLAIVCLAVALVAGPLLLGGTPPLARFGLEAAMTLACILWLAAGSPPASLTVLPVAVAAAACLQILPLPDALLRWISPLAAAAWREAAPNALGTISVNPGATTIGISRLLLGLATVAAVSDLARRAGAGRWLFTAITVAAVAIWSLGLAFPVDAKERILLGFIDGKGPIKFWQSEITEPVQSAGTGQHEVIQVGNAHYEMPAWTIGDGFGSYVVSNHFAGALCLTVPVAIAAWLCFTRGRFPNVARYGAAAVILAAALFTAGRLADSRAGAASILLAGLVLFALVAEKPLGKRCAIFGLAAYASLLLVFCGFFFGPWTGLATILPEGIRQPLHSLRSDGRVVATRVAGQMLADAPLAGTGLDTFGDLQPHYLGNVFHLHYAHNDYVQWIAETGILGGAFLAFLAGILIARGWRFYREVSPPARCLDAGAWASLTGIALHSAFDWNLHVPANALLAAVIAGLALASGRPTREGGTTADRPGLRRAAAALLAIGCLVSCGILAREAASAMTRRELATAIVEARKAASAQAPLPLAACTNAVKAGERAARWNSGDARLSVLIGQALLHLDRQDQAADAPAASEQTADDWFRRARLASPVVRGGAIIKP
jgi:hypothetical protein